MNPSDWQELWDDRIGRRVNVCLTGGEIIAARLHALEGQMVLACLPHGDLCRVPYERIEKIWLLAYGDEDL